MTGRIINNNNNNQIITAVVVHLLRNFDLTEAATISSPPPSSSLLSGGPWPSLRRDLRLGCASSTVIVSVAVVAIVVRLNEGLLVKRIAIICLTKNYCFVCFVVVYVVL